MRAIEPLGEILLCGEEPFEGGEKKKKVLGQPYVLNFSYLALEFV